MDRANGEWLPNGALQPTAGRGKARRERSRRAKSSDPAAAELHVRPRFSVGYFTLTSVSNSK